MKRFFIFLFCLSSVFLLSLDNKIEPTKIETIETGIILDSMDNEVLLVFENGNPAYYKSEIFTPVCNTGECLPVYINIYWNLNGDYLKFDQPEGEILTKLDHQPFTDADYELLNEIIKDLDPRLSLPELNHSQGKQDNQISQGSPAPSMSLKIDKHAMVDGISGATLPERQNQFVPGALYTTYTIWGLANDSKHKMRAYTREHLLDKYQHHLLSNEDLQCRMDVIEVLAAKKSGENARAKVLMDLLDSGDSLIQSAALTAMYSNYYSLDEMQDVLDRTFYKKSSFMIQRNIIWGWVSNQTPPKVLVKLSKNLITYEQHFPEIMAVFENKTDYPEGVVANMLKAFSKLKVENQQLMRTFFEAQKEYFSRDDWNLIKKFK